MMRVSWELYVVNTTVMDMFVASIYFNQVEKTPDWSCV